MAVRKVSSSLITNPVKQNNISADTIIATGGTITSYTDSDGVQYRVHTFTGTGTFTITNGSANIDYVCIAAGGGRVGEWSGGGGAGGMLEGSFQGAIGSYTCTVGGGNTAANGSNSSISGPTISVTAIGGGHGGGRFSPQRGNSGGSGGGSAQGQTGPLGWGPQGHRGADSGGLSHSTGGGGRNAQGNSTTGGSGRDSYITGAWVTYARGGDGAFGGTFYDIAGLGNGAKGQNGGTGPGNSGVVILRYKA